MSRSITGTDGLGFSSLNMNNMSSIKLFLLVHAEKQTFRIHWWIVFVEWMVDRQNSLTPYFQPGPLLEILTMLNLRHAASRVLTYPESQFSFCSMKLCSTDNHHTTAPSHKVTVNFVTFPGAIPCKVIGNHFLVKTNLFKNI